MNLRIFQVIEASTNPLVPGNRTWYRNLYEPLVDMGCEVVLFPADEGRQAMERNNNYAKSTFSQKLFDCFRYENEKKPFDLFFSYLMDGMIETGVIDEIHRLGIPTCNFSCNNAHQFYLVDELSPHFDYNLHAEKFAREKFLAIGATPLWWPMASNPKYFKPLKSDRIISVSFVGANYGLRARYIAHLLENGIDVQTYGPGWQLSTGSRKWRTIAKHYLLALRALASISLEARVRSSALLADHDLRCHLSVKYANHFHTPISDDELIALYSQSHISIGFLEVYDQHDPSKQVLQHLHLREFEAPMRGALYCTGYSDELAEMFEPDLEVLIYRNQHELLDKIRYYLNRPEEANRIRFAGRTRALRDHTYHKRFIDLFDQINLKHHYA